MEPVKAFQQIDFMGYVPPDPPPKNIKVAVTAGKLITDFLNEVWRPLKLKELEERINSENKSSPFHYNPYFCQYCRTKLKDDFRCQNCGAPITDPYDKL